MPPDTAAAMEAIARAVERLTPSWQRPERFHEQKSEILAALRTLARGPLLVRHVVRFVPAAPPPPAVPARGCEAGWRRTRHRHRYPQPARRVPGQGALHLEEME